MEKPQHHLEGTPLTGWFSAYRPFCILVYRKNNCTTNGLWMLQDRQSLSYSTINCQELWRLAMQWDGLYRKRCMYMSSTHAIVPRQPRIAPTVTLPPFSRTFLNWPASHDVTTTPNQHYTAKSILNIKKCAETLQTSLLE